MGLSHQPVVRVWPSLYRSSALPTQLLRLPTPMISPQDQDSTDGEDGDGLGTRRRRAFHGYGALTGVDTVCMIMIEAHGS